MTRHLLLLLIVAFSSVFGQERAKLTRDTIATNIPISEGPRPDALDLSFHFTGTNKVIINDLLLLPNGDIAYAGVTENPTFRENGRGFLHPDGSFLDQNNATFDAGESLALDGEGAVIFAGQSLYEPLTRTMGQSDDFGFHVNLAGEVRKVLIQNSGGDITVCGTVHQPSGSDTNWFGLARFKRTGQRNASFDSADSRGLSIITGALDDRGAILASWSKTNESTQLIYGFSRWLADGARDTNFTTALLQMGDRARVTVLEPIPGSKDFLAAVEYISQDATLTRLVVLSSNGTPSANPNFPLIQGKVNAISFQTLKSETAATGAYDQILAGGDFNRIGDLPCNNLAAIDKSGAILWEVSSDQGPNGEIRALEFQLDGAIFVGGNFTQFNGLPANSLVRLNGAKSSGKARVFWDRPKFRGFEKFGRADLTVSRSGDLARQLNLNLSVTHLSTSSTDFGALRTTVHFPGGVSNLLVSLPLINDSLHEGLERALVRLSAVIADEVVITRPETELTILDDETPGTPDPTFVPPIASAITAIRQQPDGKSLFAYNTGLSGVFLMRMNIDGTFDPSFTTNGVPFLFPSYINQIEVAPSGQIYISGSFNTITTGYGINHLARLNSNGTLDTNFNPHLSVAHDYTTAPFALQSDGKLVVGLTGRSISFQNRFGLLPTRLNLDGSIDPTFNLDSSYALQGIFTSITHLLVQQNGEILVGASARGSTDIYRFFPDGRLDTNFTVTPLNLGSISEFTFAEDYLLVAGSFRALNGIPAKYLSRVRLADGLADTNFVVNTDTPINQVRYLKGKIYISGNFTTIDGQDRFRFARLNNDGSLDTTFDSGFGFFPAPYAFEPLPDGRLLVGGLFENLGPAINANLVRLEEIPSPGEIRPSSRQFVANESDSYALIEFERIGGSSGTLSATFETIDCSALHDVNFASTTVTVSYADGEFGRKSFKILLVANPLLTGNKTFAVRFTSPSFTDELTVLVKDQQELFDGAFAPKIIGGTNAVRDMKVGADGKIYLSGDFVSINSYAVTNLARFNADFSLDTNFALAEIPLSASFLPAPIEAIAVRPDGHIAFSGDFVQIGTNNWPFFAQIDANGDYDAPFIATNQASFGFTAKAKQLELQPDGKLVGVFGILRRLLPNGARDKTFGATSGSINRITLRPDGWIFAITDFGVSKITTNGLNSSFFASTTFRSASGEQSAAGPNSITIEADSSVLIGGPFTHVGGLFLPRIARLFPNGVPETNFVASVGINASLSARDTVLAIQPLAGGDILVGGRFQWVAGKTRPLIARLSPSGALHEDFQPLVLGDHIDQFVPLPDGHILVRGGITNVEGVEVNGVFKLHLTDRLPPVVQIVDPTNGTNFTFSDAISPIDIQIHAYDPDGFLQEVRLDLDGVPMVTNTIGNFFFAFFPPPSGPHQLTAIARDETGLFNTNTVQFTVTYLPWPDTLQISRKNEKLVLTFIGTLQFSDDLRTWTDLPGASPQTIDPISSLRFYRSISR